MIDEGPPDPLTPGDHGEYTVKHYPPKTTKKNGGKPAEILSPWTGATLNGKSRQEETNSKTEQEEAPPTSLGEWDAGDDTEAPPPRAWLLGNIFCRMFLSSLLGDGGVVKTAARIAQLLSLAIRRSLTGEHVFQRCRVLIVSLEDNRDELKRRILAACLHHGIQPSELKGRLFLATPGADGGKLMTIDRNGRLLRGDMAAKLEATIKAREIDIVSLDPFVKAHSVPENDNSLIDDVVQVLTDLSAKYNIAVDVPHHMAKGAADPGNANKGRGASAMKDAGRLVYTLTTMSTDEAKAFGIKEDQRKSYVRMDSAKINITRHGKTKWFRLIGVRLGNATEMYPNGDEVQTVEPWNPPETWADLSSDLLNKILTAIGSGLPDGNRYSDSHNAKERVAWKVVTEHAPQKTEAQAREIIKIANEPMKLLKTKQSEKDPVKSGSDLAERIKAARAEAEAFIDLKTAELKAAPDGALLPIGVLRQMITRHSRCACAVALNILEPKT